MTFNPPLFSLENESDWKTHLHEEGYVVINNIISDRERSEYFKQFAIDWNHVSPKFDFEDVKTWGIEHTPMMYGKGQAVFNGFGQSDFMWNLRLSPNIQDIFKRIHKTDDLAVSLDGFSVFLSEKQKSKSWLHIDQNPANTIYSIQGSYNFMKVGEEDAGFLVVPKSHINFNPSVSHKKNWILTGEEFVKQAVKLLIPKNCFTLWNSKLIHSNIGMKKSCKKLSHDKTKNINQINRLTAYITYLPKHLQSINIIEDRKKAYLNSDTTSHWANKCEIKRYPWGFGKRYTERGYNTIISRVDENGKIPEDRLKLI